MSKYWKCLLIFGLQLTSQACFAQQTRIDSLDFSTSDQLVRMTFDVTSSPKHRVFVLENPSRLVIDIKDARIGRKINQPPSSHPLFSRIRSASKDENDLRIVIDLKKAISPKNYSLSSNNNDNHRLIVDLAGKNAVKTDTKAVEKVIALKSAPGKTEPKQQKQDNSAETPLNNVAQSSEAKILPNKFKDIVIAVDAGHGGSDPGAQGLHGTQEKKVTFAIAKKLAALINGQPGMKAVMVRKGDYYVGLRSRMHIARSAKADLFISIHADAFDKSDVRGASVYTLSRNGASSEAARWLADSENKADLIGGVTLDDKEDVLASVLLDLSQSATQEASVNVAEYVLKNFQDVCELHKGSVQKAGFMVLKSPDIPSILVETAFISNPLEENNLRSQAYQKKIAKAIFNGVRNYFKQAAPLNSRMAAL